MLIKICGLTTPEAVHAAADADIIGLVFYPPSPRALSIPAAAALLAHKTGQARVAALTVDATDADLETIVTVITPDILQLHGRETPARVTELKARFGLPVIKALRLEKAADLAITSAYPMADWLLLEGGGPAPGGNATPFNWQWLSGWQPPQPWLLAGGLTTETVADAIHTLRPDGVDVSSGVEREKGIKDPAKIRKFLQAAREAAKEGV